ncbi:MAG: hypothetical protein DI629_19845 [Mesorhizobium amorphae]|nr:MAG: hypothetical protein DI629_19845 [Mesorhizobium amorphae]
MVLALLAVAWPAHAGEAARVSDERSFFHIPGQGDFRSQKIARADNEQDWPFTVDEGLLMCAYILGQPTVYFADVASADSPRLLAISTDPMQLSFGNLGFSELLKDRGDLATLIPRIAPFAQAGSRLCLQPRGTDVGPGEL